MFLRSHRRMKDGKEHRYYSIEESRRLQSGRVVQRRVLYLGEIKRRPVPIERDPIESNPVAEYYLSFLRMLSMPAEVGVARDTHGGRALPQRRCLPGGSGGRLGCRPARCARRGGAAQRNGSPGVDCTHSILDGFERGYFNTERRGL
jgi:hypothetical protein